MEEVENGYRIETFVFFDLETTGFDSHSRILELSMVAVSRKDLLEMKTRSCALDSQQKSTSRALSLPRVLHKLTQLYYPRRLISKTVEGITGLCNDNTHHLSSFSASSASTIKNFLQLPPPVCLIAHNGKVFDFPILKAELITVNSDDWKGILCGDSLLFARQYEKDEIEFMTNIAKTFSDTDFFNDSTEPQDGLPCCSYSPTNGASSTINGGNISSTNGIITSLAVNNVVDTNFTPVSQDIFRTPEKQAITSKFCPKTPIKNGKLQVNFESEYHSPMLKQEMNSQQPLEKRKANRALYSDKRHDMSKPFSQPTLYYRIFRSDYESHRAEADALALLQICGYYGEDFINWADKHCAPFQMVKPRWTPRKKTFIL